VKGKDVAIQRVQIHGTSAVHPVVTLQHYLVALHTEGAVNATLDMSVWLRRHATEQLLEGLVFGNGVVCTTVLKKILPPPLRPILAENFEPADCQNLHKYGPALVPCWRVAKGFEASRGAHVGQPPKEGKDCHAMLLVGYREHNGQLRLLLQNWWDKKQFVDVDEVYFNECSETTVFVTAPQKEFPKSFELTGDAFSISAADGSGVSGIGEPVG
jgi:hypothetical protein